MFAEKQTRGLIEEKELKGGKSMKVERKGSERGISEQDVCVKLTD